MKSRIMSNESDAPTLDNLADLLREVRGNYTRDDDLPDNLLPRIDQALDALDRAGTRGGLS